LFKGWSFCKSVGDRAIHQMLLSGAEGGAELSTCAQTLEFFQGVNVTANNASFPNAHQKLVES